MVSRSKKSVKGSCIGHLIVRSISTRTGFVKVLLYSFWLFSPIDDTDDLLWLFSLTDDTDDLLDFEPVAGTTCLFETASSKMTVSPATFDLFVFEVIADLPRSSPASALPVFFYVDISLSLRMFAAVAAAVSGGTSDILCSSSAIWSMTTESFNISWLA